MRAVLFVFACVSFVAGQDINSLRDMPKYDKRYDYLSVDAILENKRLVRNYVDCLINAKPCTPEGKALKKILPEALRTKCIRCTENQKQTAVKVIKRVKADYPEDWQKLASRWDPTGDFTRYFEEVLTRDHFNTIPNGNEIPGSSPLPTPPPPSPPTQTTRRPFSPPPPPTLPPLAVIPQTTTTPRPVILNRFGDDGELMTNGRPAPPVTTRPTTVRPVYTTRPSPTYWAGAASDVVPTQFNLRPTKDIMPPYTTAITLIDQIGYKIIRTTELVTDILRNTVRAVVGR
ncbi:arp2/3 complex-activating protein rickA-like isoform X2 [Leguminivora glycinivorella]|uniref:arp2/3 complex-activating protein rickA-like isoform X2 n=1 Tax=Leguminivora glycinivorella TaxID=1035111 RepID=UPI00200CDFAD|nr:arp2/3 complex-activating protein rickA-like isoform X2 [Leguminivora glycinivorella]